MYLLNRDAFTLLVMGYSKEFTERKIAFSTYIDAPLANGKNKWYHYSSLISINYEKGELNV